MNSNRTLSKQKQDDLERIIKECTEDIIRLIFDSSEQKKNEKINSITGLTKSEILENIRNGNFETGYEKNIEY